MSGAGRQGRVALRQGPAIAKSWVFIFLRSICTNGLEGLGFTGGTSGKEPPANEGDIRDMGLIPGSGRSPGGGGGNQLQYSWLESPTERGAWQATVHRVAKSGMRLSMHAHLEG